MDIEGLEEGKMEEKKNEIIGEITSMEEELQENEDQEEKQEIYSGAKWKIKNEYLKDIKRNRYKRIDDKDRTIVKERFKINHKGEIGLETIMQQKGRTNNRAHNVTRTAMYMVKKGYKIQDITSIGNNKTMVYFRNIEEANRCLEQEEKEKREDKLEGKKRQQIRRGDIQEEKWSAISKPNDRRPSTCYEINRSNGSERETYAQVANKTRLEKPREEYNNSKYGKEEEEEYKDRECKKIREERERASRKEKLAVKDGYEDWRVEEIRKENYGIVMRKCEKKNLEENKEKREEEEIIQCLHTIEGWEEGIQEMKRKIQKILEENLKERQEGKRRVRNFREKDQFQARDFNAHHRVWNCKNTNRNGEILLEEMEERELFTVNNDTVSRMREGGVNDSNLDIMFATKEIYEKMIYNIEEDSWASLPNSV
ncbi:vicilin-like seed storage protein At2g18540 [Monomorium pharaonis]|uniref:vicilin-like seed storage protein At2g18540 n=1 Tax=Monomorium pharaonis TaxID=307658 RepID=UPI001746864B|nr:vicilin-like seed storage protein At2g18540 [Monomorium pharaonis]